MDLKRKHWISIQRYVTGNAGTEDQRLLNEWMNQDPENRKLVQEIQDIWNLTPPENFEADAQHAWEEFRSRNSLPMKKPVYRKVSKVPLYVLRIAAVVLVSVFAGVFMQYTLTNNGDPELVSEFYIMETFETQKGEKARVSFSDGTKVMLNSSSSIQFPKEFRGSNREVYLEGEAYFEVAHDPDLPFVVHVQDAKVEVLGTEFNIRGWKEDPAVEVAVRDGKVAVGSTDEQQEDQPQVILTKDLYTSVNRGAPPSPARRTNITSHLIWTHGGLFFDNVPFIQVIRDIERRFNVNIEGVDPDLLEIPYTGTFQYAELDEVLSVVAASINFEYQRVGSEIIINK